VTRLAVRVPATCANVGAGFDAFGLALELCNEITLDTGASPGVTWEGEGASELPTDGSDLVSSAIRRLVPDVTFALHGTNRIPLERGLGSSSAAIVGGVALGCVLRGETTGADLDEVFRIAAEIEGHSDNVAAATYGGFTIVVDTIVVERFDPHPDVRPVVLIPEGSRISTEEARRRLPRDVPLDDVVYNAAHAGLTAAAIVARPSALVAALGDRLHERQRLSLVPDVGSVFESIRDAGVPVCVAGSGPSLLAFEIGDARVPAPSDGWRVERLPVRPTGVELVGA
jgi:homoserine kinase